MAPGRWDGHRRQRGLYRSVLLLAALLLAGVGTAVAAPSSPGPTAEPTGSPSCSSPPLLVDWYGLDTAATPAIPTVGRTFWDVNSVAIGYETTGPADGFFVASDRSGEILGVTRQAVRSPVHVDGLRIDLETNLTGVRTVRVDWYCDVDGNGELDPDIDSPAGVAAGPTSIDFDATYDMQTAHAVTDWVRTTTEPTDSERPPPTPSNRATTPGQPGFISLVALLTIVGVALMAGRQRR